MSFVHRPGEATVPDTSVLPDLLTAQQIAAKYDLHIESIYRWIDSGELVAFKLGKSYAIYPQDWNAFLAHRREAVLTDRSITTDDVS